MSRRRGSPSNGCSKPTPTPTTFRPRPYLQQELGGKIAIGSEIKAVQAIFADIFNEGSCFACDGSQFDRLFDDGDGFSVGEIPALALHVPGHTPADMAYMIGDALFVGDTMFMPDYGTARCDFPGGDARHLYRSIKRLMALPDETRAFLCHDYKAPGRNNYAWETTSARSARAISTYAKASARTCSSRCARSATRPFRRPSSSSQRSK